MGNMKKLALIPRRAPWERTRRRAGRRASTGRGAAGPGREAAGVTHRSPRRRSLMMSLSGSSVRLFVVSS